MRYSMLMLVVVLSVLLLTSGCVERGPKFTYQQKVDVVKGFFRVRRGCTVTDYRVYSNYDITYEVTCSDIVITVPESVLVPAKA